MSAQRTLRLVSFRIAIVLIGIHQAGRTVWVQTIRSVPEGLYRAIGSQLIYNHDSKEGTFFGAFTSDRFLTIMRLQIEKGASSGRKIVS